MQPIPIFKERVSGTFNPPGWHRIAHLENFFKEILKAHERQPSPPAKPRTLAAPSGMTGAMAENPVDRESKYHVASFDDGKNFYNAC